MRDASRLERGLLLAVLAAFVILGCLDRLYWRTGFSTFDEEGTLDLLQAWREGGEIFWRLGNGSLSRTLNCALTAAFGPRLSLLYLVPQLAVALEALLLFLWLKPRLGERAALWACLADLICAATYARSRSLLSPALMPACFLALAVTLDRLRKPWQDALWAAAAVFLWLDYEGWLIALAWLGPAWAWQRGRGRGAGARWTAAGLGAALSLAFVLSRHPGLSQHLAERKALSLPPLGLALQAWGNLRDLFLATPRLAFAGADGHPWLPYWLWPLIPLGALALWRRHAAAYGLLLAGFLPLLLKLSAVEAHRFSLALLALAAAGGCGAARLLERRWGPWALGALLCFGLADEGLAWAKADPHRVAFAYGRSCDLIAAADWMREHQPALGWRVLDGVGPFFDGAFRFLLDERGVKRDGAVPIVLVHADYGMALKGLRGSYRAFNGTGQLPTLLFLPTPAEAQRLAAAQRELAPLQQLLLHAWPAEVQALTERRLQDPALRDPWTRTVYWEAWMQSNVRQSSAEIGPLSLAVQEPLVSGWIFDVAAGGLAQQDGAAAKALRARALQADPRRKDLVYREVRL